MSKNFPIAASLLRNVAENPGSSIEELQEQVKTLAQIMADVVQFLDNDLAGKIVADISRKEGLRS